MIRSAVAPASAKASTSSERKASGTATPRSSTARSTAITGVNCLPARQCSEWIRHVSSNVRRTISGGTSLSRSSSLQARVRRSSSVSCASRAIVSQKSYVTASNTDRVHRDLLPAALQQEGVVVGMSKDQRADEDPALRTPHDRVPERRCVAAALDAMPRARRVAVGVRQPRVDELVLSGDRA